MSGPFASLARDHRFERVDGRTPMHDTLRFRSPAGPVGDSSTRRLLEGRSERFVAVAEGEAWRRFLDP